VPPCFLYCAFPLAAPSTTYSPEAWILVGNGAASELSTRHLSIMRAILYFCVPQSFEKQEA